VEGAHRLRAFLGLGSNVGDRLANLRAGVQALERRAVAVTDRSAVYETEPQAGAIGQRDFLNACIAIETDLEPDDLLVACKAVEVELGRDLDAPRHAARPLDVDVLLIDGREHHSAKLQIPHADLLARRFVLEPLLELDPPGRERLELALERTRDQRVARVGSL
jgi:2-amino-4-hydroxy-6-hydroxymethyldihydropteridine diphosphokinase